MAIKDYILLYLFLRYPLTRGKSTGGERTDDHLKKAEKGF